MGRTEDLMFQAGAETLIEDESVGSLVDCFRSQSEFRGYLRGQKQQVLARWLVEKSMRHRAVFRGKLQGWCELTASDVSYSFDVPPYGESLDLREQLICSETGLPARVRFVALLTLQLVKPGAEVYITEQLTPAYRWIKTRFPVAIGSEYFEETDRPILESALASLSQYGERLRFEDVTNLSWPDDRFDAVVSQEVLEHVPSYRHALKEFWRVLRPGGYLFLTVPFKQDALKTLIRARREEDGSVTHFEQPDYHGDPVRAGGVLCFQDFGWDLLEEVRQCGFRDALMALPWSYSQGLMGPLWTLVARK